nr:immunoglobulin light chain junction region [Macaca mulatta]
CIQALEFPRTF